MTTNEPPSYPGDSTPGGNQPPAGSGDSGTSGPPSYGSTPPPAGETPPPPPPPPSAPGGSAEGFSAPDAIGWGWRKFSEKPGPVIIAGLLWFVVLVVFIAVGRATNQSGMGMGGGMDFGLDSLIFGIVQNLVLLVIGAVIARGALDVVDGRGFDLAAAFGKVNFVNVIIAGLIVGVATAIGFLLLFIPGIVVAFLAYFTTFFVVDDDATSPVEAITDSVKLVSSNVGDSLLLALLNVLILIAGGIALLVGLIVAYPLVALASAYAYRRFRGQPVTA
jgi:uncharacterized membrane protein